MAKLIAKEAFGAFGKRYEVGAEVPLEDTKSWPEGTLETRLSGGSLGYEAETEAEVAAGGLTAAGVVAVAKREFTAWGVHYPVGAPIPEDHHSKWPTGTLTTRLNNGDVEFKPEEEVIPATPATSEPSAPSIHDEDPNDVDVNGLTAAEIVTFAKRHFNTDLDPSHPWAQLAEAAEALVHASQS